MSDGEVNNAIPDNCEWKDLVKPYKSNDDENIWKNTALSECAKSFKEKYEKAAEAKYKKQYEKEKKALYSGTSVATGSIGAGAGGLACGLGLFPCLVKLVSKFR